MNPMTARTLDITGKVCPYCIIALQESVADMRPGDEVVVICDHPAAATGSIPQFAEDTGMTCVTGKTSPGLWEIRLIKK